MIGQLGLRGISVLESSGDTGILLSIYHVHLIY